jgi:hypothetical protein
MLKEAVRRNGKLTQKYNILINKSEINAVMQDILTSNKKNTKITVEVKHGFI